MKNIIKSLSVFILFGSLAVSCGSAKDATNEEALTASTWKLTSLNGAKISDSDYSRGVPYINFSQDNKISGNGGCNGFSGTYNLNDEGGINVSQIAATKIFCEGAKENEFFKAIEESDMTKIDADKLILMKGVDETMIFTATDKK